MPFCSKCGTEVSIEISFCSKCGNKLQGEQNEMDISQETRNGFTTEYAKQEEDDSKVSFFERLLNFFNGVAWKISTIFFSIICFIIGGWDVGKVVVRGSYRNKSFILDDDFGVVFKFNDGYYGLFFEDRFFNSPFISWFLLGVSLFLFGAFFKTIFGGEGD